MSIVHSFPPIADQKARTLILGSMPGVASIEAAQYYGHPRNAFWRIMGELYGAGPTLPYESRCERLRVAGVAVWDVLRQCVRPGSLDSAIERRSEVANDIPSLLAASPRIATIAFNGGKAESAFARHIKPRLNANDLEQWRFLRLPSTSPAHAGRSFDEKLAAWRALIEEPEP